EAQATAPAPAPTRPESPEERALRRIAAWRARESGQEDSLAAAASSALQRVVSTIIRHRGKLIGDAALLRSLACTLATNDHGSRQIGRLIEPWFHEAVAREGYHTVTAQEHPIVMNVKGASASGKSTMRPLQRALAGRIGVQWSDFAVITPDIWRKYLLDYDSLGPARRYAGTLTGHEVEIVDKKLDRYMARKAREGRMSHLLIDRFRFDSFNADASSEDGSQLLTRFGHLVFMLFMITPPDATVERAWKRGEQFGRYKAVDDLLAHNVEAYTGMPRLFFTWALKADKRVHYEFLDNSVPEGERPRTVAFGVNGVMTILDLKFLLDVDRFRKINIDADGPEAVYPDANQMAPERNTDFLRQCARRMATIRFAEHGSGRVYASLDRGRLTCRDGTAYARALADPDMRAAFAAIGGDRLGEEALPTAPSEIINRDETETLGAWGDRA
ncbi:zeta toxin family protein, partial [Methylobacterium soli]|uniref:zeta toxin family protein n=1 Tax=Methylobacterium soli TaxID=553447 RepID=UPI001EE18E98